jgi:hypothetical protein
MKKVLILVGCLVIAALARFGGNGSLRENIGWDSSLSSKAADSIFASAFAERRGNFVAEGTGTVAAVLSDDNDGSPHQRFILTLQSGQTLLISHNIDLAPRVETLSVGDVVFFKGEYEWNAKGGVIHWTHHDPAGQHEAGWIRHDGKTYE